MMRSPLPEDQGGRAAALGVPDDTGAVAEAIGRWNGRELEAAGAGGGCVMPDAALDAGAAAEPHYGLLAGMPADRDHPDRRQRAGAAAGPFSDRRPAGGCARWAWGHVIAGAGLGRALALHAPTC